MEPLPLDRKPTSRTSVREPAELTKRQNIRMHKRVIPYRLVPSLTTIAYCSRQKESLSDLFRLTFWGPVQAKMHRRFNAICGLRENMTCYPLSSTNRPLWDLRVPCASLFSIRTSFFYPYHSARSPDSLPSDIRNAGRESAPRSIP